MNRQFTVISGTKPEETSTPLDPEEKFLHYRNVMDALMGDAQQIWTELWHELHGEVTDGATILPKAGNGFNPKCGWSEFIERMWLLKHHLDYARRFSEGRV